MYMLQEVQSYLDHFSEIVEEGALTNDDGTPVTQWYCLDRNFVLELELEVRKQLAACALAGSQPVSVADARAMFEQRNPEVILLSIPRYQFEAGLERAREEMTEWFTEPPPPPVELSTQEQLEELVHNFNSLPLDEQDAFRDDFEMAKAALEADLLELPPFDLVDDRVPGEDAPEDESPAADDDADDF